LTRGSSDWRAVWVVFAAGLVCGAHITKAPPALPALRVDLGIGLVESGFIHTAMFAFGALAGVFAGVAADRFGQKRFALYGMAMMAAGGVIGAAAPGYTLLLGSRFIEGAGFILLTVAAAPLLTAATQPADRPMAFSLWSSYMPAGGTVALLGAPLALATLGWRGLWLALAACTALCCVLLARRVPVPSFGGQVSSLALLTESLMRPGTLALCLVFVCYVGQWVSVMTWLPTFVVDERGASATAAALLTAAFVAINIPGNLLGGVLLRRGVPRWVVLCGAAVAMGCTAVGLLSPAAPDALRLAAALAFSLLGGAIPAAVFSGAPVHAKSAQHIGTTNGMIMQASQLAQFVIPVLVAWVAARAGGWSASLQVMLALAAAGVAAALALGLFERRLSP
jgi:DHA1 family inner membrane transport protein